MEEQLTLAAIGVAGPRHILQQDNAMRLMLLSRMVSFSAIANPGFFPKMIFRTFIVQFPLTVQTRWLNHSKPRTTVNFLLADDHKVMRSGVALLLKTHYPHANISEVADGAELLREASRGSWDLVISDISMPGRTGAELVKELSQLVAGTPILMLSSYPAEQYAVRTIKMGASGYLTKQASADELIKAVEYLLSGKKYITPEVADILANSLSAHDDRPLHEQLSEREYEVFKYLSHGRTISEIADILSLSVHTISTYRVRLLQKMALQNNADLVKYAIEHNLFQSI